MTGTLILAVLVLGVFNSISVLMSLCIIMAAIPCDRTVVDLVHLYLVLDVHSTVHYQCPYIS